MQQEFDGTKYQIRLDDGSVVAHPSLHCLTPQQANGWLFYLRGGSDVHYVAREIATQTEKILTGVLASRFGFVANAQQANVAIRISNREGFTAGNIACAIFDFPSKSWLDFSLLPQLDVFRVPGSGARPNWLWIKNGGAVQGFAGTDPCQPHSVGRVSCAIDFIEFVTLEWNGNFPKAFHRWERPISRTGLGTMVLKESWPVNNASPTEPTWLRA